MTGKDNHFSHVTSRGKLFIIERTKLLFSKIYDKAECLELANDKMKSIMLVATSISLSWLSRLDTEFSKLNFIECVTVIMFDEDSRRLKISTRTPHEWSIWGRLEQKTWDKNEKDVDDSDSIGRIAVRSEMDACNKSREIQQKSSWLFPCVIFHSIKYEKSACEKLQP